MKHIPGLSSWCSAGGLPAILKVGISQRGCWGLAQLDEASALLQTLWPWQITSLSITSSSLKSGLSFLLELYLKIWRLHRSENHSVCNHHYFHIPNMLNRRKIHKKIQIPLKLTLPLVPVVHFDFSALGLCVCFTSKQ